MGGRNPDRVQRLHTLRAEPPGWLRLAVCLDCGHKAPLPVKVMLARFGELATVERAVAALRCTACGHKAVDARLVRLCEPGCPKQRG